MSSVINILAFGIAREITGQSSFEWEFSEPLTVGELRNHLFQKYPDLSKLNALAIAVNAEYAPDSLQIRAGDEVVLIPPVSGG